MRRARKSLPAADQRGEVLQAATEAQVMVISGATGCGKSTQVRLGTTYSIPLYAPKPGCAPEWLEDGVIHTLDVVSKRNRVNLPPSWGILPILRNHCSR